MTGPRQRSTVVRLAASRPLVRAGTLAAVCTLLVGCLGGVTIRHDAATDALGHDYTAALALSGDGGALYAAGGTTGALGDRDPGGIDPWLARFDPQGRRLWLRQFGSDFSDAALAVALGRADTVYACGYRLEDDRGNNVWVAAFSADGTRRWERTLAEHFPAHNSINPMAMAVESDGDVIIAGSMHDTAGIGGGWVMALSASGDFLWLRHINSDGHDFTAAMATDRNGHIYVAGHTYGQLDGLAGEGEKDAWLVSFDNAGRRRFATQWGSGLTDYPTALAVGADGRIYVAGYTHGDLGGENQGTYDAWLSAFDAAGDLRWSRQYGHHGPDVAVALSLDAAGNIYVTGTTELDETEVDTASDDNVFIIAYGPDGALLGTELLATPAQEHVRAMALDHGGALYLAGDYVVPGGSAGRAGTQAWVGRLDHQGENRWLNLFGAPATTGAQPTDLVHETVLPSATNPSLTRQDEPHHIYVDPSVPNKSQLFVFLAGTGGLPKHYQAILRTAARLGYYAVGLTYTNSKSVRERCYSSGNLSPQCYGDVRKEIVLGADFGPSVTVARGDAIAGRLQALLLYLRAQYPGLGWGRWLQGDGSIDWSQIIVAGHSQGGGMAALIGKLVRVHRVAMFAAPADTLPSGSPAPWLAAEGETPLSDYVALSQAHDYLWSDNRSAWQALGLDELGHVVDVDALYGEPIYGYRLETFMLPASGLDTGSDPHGMVVRDLYTPRRSSGQPWFEYDGVWGYMISGEWRPIQGSAVD